jgi:hypothetical protein
LGCGWCYSAVPRLFLRLRLPPFEVEIDQKGQHHEALEVKQRAMRDLIDTQPTTMAGASAL